MSLEDILNKQSKYVTEAIADGGVKSLQIGKFKFLR